MAVHIILRMAGAALAVAPLSAAAGQRLEDVPDIRSIAFLSGRCERMMIVSEDISHVCRGPVYNTIYHSGRVSFAFPGTDRASGTELILSFSGTEERREGDRVQLLLDRITLAGDREDASSVEAEGICEYGDPYSGSTRISCAGRTQAGDFIGIFVSDGKAPTVQQF
jgi:hypothetical protein